MINNIEELVFFLRTIDEDFPIPLSEKVDLYDYAVKLYNKGTFCIKRDEKTQKIIAMVAGYTEELIDNIAYISLVAVESNQRSKGYGKELVQEFLNICKKKGIDALHLYCVDNNIPAMKMYQKLGFQKYCLENEIRKKDVHFIYYFKK